MAKKRPAQARRQTPQRRTRPSAAARPVNQKAIEEEVEARRTEAVAAAGGEESLPAPAEPPAGGVDDKAVAARWQEAAEAVALFTQAAERVAETRQALDRQNEEVAERLAALDEDARDLKARRDIVQERSGELDEREERLIDEERKLVAARERAKETALAEARKALEGTRREVEAQQRELAEEHARTRAALSAELEAQRRELAERTERLTEERARLRAFEVELNARDEDLTDARALLSERVEHAVAAAVERAELRSRELEQRCRALQDHAADMEKERDERNRVDRAFGHRSPDEVLKELQELRAQNAELRLQRQVPEDVMERLARLQEAERGWREERAVLIADNERLQRQLTGHQITALELERLKVTKEAMEASVDAYRVRVQELHQDIQSLTARKEGESPFPECHAMDTRYNEKRDDLLGRVPPLDNFVYWLRNFVAQQYRMFYAEEDLVLFLGGLAASRLHLLQGISGIGKTQLPIVFAKALQAETALVPVSADWRTPQDLVGYFNAFERRFYESPFTQALYQAGSPAHADRPFFVVLDEMNLSHPEQYFSEVLYQIGQTRKPNGAPPSLELMTTEVRPAPRGLVDGRKLVIPPNVWFVGTANHDETTVAFADKTYDRSHVLELPARPRTFEPEPVPPLPAPLALGALEAAFERARRTHAEAARSVSAFLDGELRDRLFRDFRIASGSRTAKYLEAFVPVVCAAGGSQGLAADHAFATRVLRRLRGRFEIPFDLIQALRDDLTGLWKPFGTVPSRSLERLDEEIHLRRGV
ncbi:AAA family ATPase [Actinomadura sp. NPDC048032]|uniref:AAA family ATPase n=1 Tax=Actinomadura sp. NPDC048032 TaxID=3155747 RepID=UPI0033ED9E1D